MTKTNYNINKVLDGNVVKVTETYDEPRYSGYISGDCRDICDDIIENIKEDCKIYVPKGNYKDLTSFEINYDDLTGKTLEEDREIFQKKLDETFGKGEYEAFVLGAYIHSGTSFSVNKTGNHVCQWDSSQLGFIGLRTDEAKTDYGWSANHADDLARELTDCWEGNYYEYMIIDNLTNETVESEIMSNYNLIQKFTKSALEKYNVNFDGMYPQY